MVLIVASRATNIQWHGHLCKCVNVGARQRISVGNRIRDPGLAGSLAPAGFGELQGDPAVADR
ncbi:hypothetical protein ACVMIH_006518 [Bradyrhizobium sp. USDA 4503]|uniref:hypothetical protein n=1 Tax=Bradyrhizobium TaxID=374 RepID=UPI0012E38F57|nr:MULTISPECIES: hypothetical protein [Bradyrhizobium]MCP1836387.1 hypothetical protein [Bradyrhizobium sp. USDA 4545]MCP1921136.1 hypothetical protein [Bradyrhizobium sp. USDA 4532]